MSKQSPNAVVGRTYIKNQIDNRSGMTIRRVVKDIDDYDVHYLIPAVNGGYWSRCCSHAAWNRWVKDVWIVGDAQDSGK